MGDYTPRTWVEGEKGKASDLNHIEEGLDVAQQEAEGGARLNVRKFKVELTQTGALNLKGINEAVVSLPATGGTLFFPERGTYNVATVGKTEPINAEKRSGVVFQGQGGVSAGGGLGYPKGGEPAVNFPPTALAYAGRGTAFLNSKKSTGCGLVDIQVYAYKKEFAEDSGYVVDWSESNFMFALNATVQCSGEGGEIIQAKLMRLDNSNCGDFFRLWLKGGKEAVIGRLLGGGSDYSYQHTFLGGGVVAQSGKSIVHIHNGWGFYGFAFEPHYSQTSVKTGCGGGWIGQTGGAGFESVGTVLSNCFFGAAPTEETGNAIEWFGTGLTIQGGELACCENAIVIPLKSSGIRVECHINLCVVGLAITSTNANEVSKLRYEPTLGKRNGGGAITPYVFTTGKPKSAKLLATEGEEFKKLKAALNPATATAKEAAELANELRAVLISNGFAE